jgi:tetratricopeptide (TPR) repeat protein
MRAADDRQLPAIRPARAAGAGQQGLAPQDLCDIFRQMHRNKAIPVAMSKKALNQSNLEKLGAEQLASLVMDLVQGSAALQRRARMELSAAQGPREVAADLRKRFASLRRATSFVGWRKQRALVKDLETLLGMIETSLAPQDPDEAFELLWSFLQLAPSIHERTDDSNGAIGSVMSDAVDLIAGLAPRISKDRTALAERVLEAVAEAGYGEFDGIIPATAEALGPEGLEHLKSITQTWAEAPPTEHELEQYQGYGLMSSAEDSVRRNKQVTRSIILADVADAQGDVDAYMARYSAEQLTYGTIAPDVARRLLDAGRVDEAFDIVTRARAAEDGTSFRMFRYDLDAVFEECLERQGKTDELKAHLWTTFEQTLSAPCLRKYLKLLPDFDDIEAEQAALDVAEACPHLGAAISFLVDWPSHDRAARVVLARAEELDGNSYDTLTTAADALESGHPLAATLMRRAMILDTLTGGKSKRYRHAARHLAECQPCDAAIEDYGDHPSHTQFLEGLKQEHGRKHGFWRLVDP